MTIIGRKEFLKLPAYTVFSKFSPDNFGPIQIKVCSPEDGWTNDFIVQNIESSFQNDGSEQFSDRCDLMRLEGASFPMDFDSAGRDGLFDREQLFAVWSKEDVKRLIERLSMCV